MQGEGRKFIIPSENQKFSEEKTKNRGQQIVLSVFKSACTKTGGSKTTKCVGSRL